jgi:hypothetical protein
MREYGASRIRVSEPALACERTAVEELLSNREFMLSGCFHLLAVTHTVRLIRDRRSVEQRYCFAHLMISNPVNDALVRKREAQ